MNVFRKELQALLKAARRESAVGGRAALDKRARKLFDMYLGGGDIYATDESVCGELLHITVDPKGVAVMYHVGGRLWRRDAGGRIYYETLGGPGRSFKFMPHLEDDVVTAADFFAVGFPYLEERLALVPMDEGTVAVVKGDVHPIFSIDALDRVTPDSIHDMRIFSSGELADKVCLLFEELVSDADGAWDRVFYALNS
ncbi:MAG: hypothetical protein UY31_C0057G0008 [Candidatus Wolfebacteria bacterium GW2011_GWE1_48_7]|uniref:Uncharacterized protein n=2 Tax=Candidatus Wolfeibacteriota TaxID=1752735 RepID=A0A0G1U605_9BACT|nr:MAG: hypothetical protein UX70_C0001G0549 [Candidatus Wolfebacteria bacterium GW2011_GWB1_47_1]KKU36989.1 MAG: hypothetical protein UX49_C0004G0008 [Candidatus Wolfebacteria bacterium GW2011_GWC2_46_275]KKU42517.1 MAG: hypothetical protein UX58_C0002G0231 [Candidatus Wolfebacteria bacterium GW2011_GWB2_46_69]KKU53894.1 MAG: hypothetical protein UX76_C0008G0017 [Candidatus Wolfebacteria bacterium GW2011_GWC1_47_103]KKU59670.1 MAG: hypothetical protein UX83_C0003G0085 [Candidatus Wolfebacteria